MILTHYHVLLARTLAEKAHCNQLYGNFPFLKHLEDVTKCAMSFGVGSPEILVTCFLHDTLEDTCCSLKTIQAFFGDTVAKAVEALTNGNDNKPRYDLLVGSNLGLLVKLFDRLANISQAILEGNPKGIKYVKQHKEFEQLLYQEKHASIWEVLNGKIAMYETLLKETYFETHTKPTMVGQLL
ncbi:hypothetical protein N9954_06850 [Maribacter sp.]|nr:hypothetical protein [Maribacter sp.]